MRAGDEELERCVGTQFDPRLIEIFVRAMRQLPNPIIEVASLLVTLPAVPN